MPLDSQILLLLSAFGAFNGLFIAIYFFISKPKDLSNKFLGAMVLMISIRVLKSVLYYFNSEITKTILQIGLSACFLIGPLLYFYCLSKTDQLKEQLIKWPIHLGGLILITLILGLIYPYQNNSQLWGNVLYKIINYVWLFYIVLSSFVLAPKFKNVMQLKLKTDEETIWQLSIFAGNFAIWFAFYTSAYTSYILGAISFSFIFYIMALIAFFKHQKNVQKLPIKYLDKKIIEPNAQPLISQLNYIMTEQQLYKDANLTLPILAKKLTISTQHLSQLLNDNLKKSFSFYVNEFRIQAAKQLLTGEKAMKMDDIAQQSGFNSQSTFYTAFKKISHTTPAKYRDSKI